MKGADIFAGAGGFTEGGIQAGLRMLWAGNHWRAAVDIHALNHPEAEHACQDLRQVDWGIVPSHDFLLASPCCHGHSKARGKDRPQHDKSRATAWAVVDCAEYHRPEYVIVENVQEFLSWALYPAWELAMQRLGYAMMPYVVDAADHGVPQYRKRLFIICSKSRAPVMLALPRRQHKPSSSFIDFDSGNWGTIYKPLTGRPRSPKRIAQWEAGRKEFGERFLMPYYGSAVSGWSIDRPIGTITTRDRWAAVDGERVRFLTADECRMAMGFPDAYILPEQHSIAVHMLGNAVPPIMARDIIKGVISA